MNAKNENITETTMSDAIRRCGTCTFWSAVRQYTTNPEDVPIGECLYDLPELPALVAIALEQAGGAWDGPNAGQGCTCWRPFVNRG